MDNVIVWDFRSSNKYDTVCDPILYIEGTYQNSSVKTVQNLSGRCDFVANSIITEVYDCFQHVI